MGYSGRYHAASLAAVFLALAVGILIGVGFGSDVVTGTAEDLERSLSSDLDQAREQIEGLEAELDTERQFSDAAAPAVVADRLRAREIALVALGDLDPELVDDVRTALDPAGATLQEIAVVRQPPDTDDVTGSIPGDERDEPRGEALERAGRIAGRALIFGGEGFDELRTAVFSRYSGEPGDIDGVVLVRETPEDFSGREEDDTDRLDDALIEGMRSATTVAGAEPVIVGAEPAGSDPSSIDYFADRDAASVDNVNQLPGRVALVYALDGAEGNFGVGPAADALLPDLLDPTAVDSGEQR